MRVFAPFVVFTTRTTARSHRLPAPAFPSMLNVTHISIVLEACGVNTEERAASQMLFALRE
jgi:hypothetical protein